MKKKKHSIPVLKVYAYNLIFGLLEVYCWNKNFVLVVKLWACVGIIQTKKISLNKKKIWRRIYLKRSYKETKEKWKDSLNIKWHCKICYCKQNGKRWFEWSFFLIKAEVKEKNQVKCVEKLSSVLKAYRS